MDFESTALSNATQHRIVSERENIPWSQPGSLSVVACSDERRVTALPEPEKRLMFAVLEDAIECFQENHSAHYGQRRRAFVDAERWIFGTKAEWVFGFENICSVLHFDPEYIRKGLRRWREKESLKRALASSGSTLGGEPAAQASKTLRVAGVTQCPSVNLEVDAK